jgi:hypothetical protein
VKRPPCPLTDLTADEREIIAEALEQAVATMRKMDPGASLDAQLELSCLQLKVLGTLRFRERARA